MVQPWKGGNLAHLYGTPDDFLGKADARPHSSKRQLQDGEGVARGKNAGEMKKGISETNEQREPKRI